VYTDCCCPGRWLGCCRGDGRPLQLPIPPFQNKVVVDTDGIQLAARASGQHQASMGIDKSTQSCARFRRFTMVGVVCGDVCGGLCRKSRNQHVTRVPPTPTVQIVHEPISVVVFDNSAFSFAKRTTLPDTLVIKQQRQRTPSTSHQRSCVDSVTRSRHQCNDLVISVSSSVFAASSATTSQSKSMETRIVLVVRRHGCDSSGFDYYNDQYQYYCSSNSRI
jgi:hypothetical protein